MFLPFVLSASLVLAPSAWDEADTHAAAGAHAEAAAAYARAWDEDNAPAILYSWAQSARQAGDCATAIDLYARFEAVGSAPPAVYDSDALRAQWTQMLANAAAQREVCADQVAVRGATDPPVEPATDGSGEQVGPEPTVGVAGPDTEPDPRGAGVADGRDAMPQRDDRPRADVAAHGANLGRREPVSPRRAPDAAGWTLVGLGGATALGGGIAVTVAALRDRGAPRVGTHDDFLEAVQRARVEQTVGFVALGLGAALAVGGAVRWGVVRGRRRGAAAASRLRLGAPGVVVRF